MSTHSPSLVVMGASVPSWQLPWIQYGIMIRLFLAEYRTMWYFYGIFQLAWPLGFLYMTAHLYGVLDRDQAIFLVGGNVTTAITFGPLFILLNKMSIGYQTNEFTYWATLPLAKITFFLSLISVALFQALPGILIILLSGVLFFHIPLLSGLLLLPLLPLGTLPLAGIGILVGSSIKNPQTAGVIGNILTITISFFSPMFIHISQLPLALHILAFVFPTTYVADLFRVLLGVPSSFSPLLDLGIIVGCGITCLFLIYHKLDWQRK